MRLDRITQLLITILLVFSISLSASFAFALDDEETKEEVSIIWSTVDHYTWIYQADDRPLSEFTFLINGSTDKEKIHATKYKESLHVIFSLNYEKNTVEIKYASEILLKKEVHYYPAFESELVLGDAILEPFHTAENEASCSGTSGCHRMTVEPSDIEHTDIKSTDKEQADINIAAKVLAAKMLAAKMLADKRLAKKMLTNKAFADKIHADIKLAVEKLVDKELDDEKFDTIKFTGKKKQICYQCHFRKFDKYKYLHKPAAEEWRCLLCHDMEARETDSSPDAPVRFTIENPEEVASLCYKCHEILHEYIDSQEYIHGPIGMEGCTMCHSPHGSTQKKLLHDNATTLCVNCHEAQDMLELPVVHEVIKQKGCVACHNPHASPYPMQLREDITKLCYTCHIKIGKLKNNHPVQGHPSFIKEEPPSDDYIISCIKCHSPHASEYDKLLPAEEFMMVCIICHNYGGM